MQKIYAFLEYNRKFSLTYIHSNVCLYYEHIFAFLCMYAKQRET